MLRVALVAALSAALCACQAAPAAPSSSPSPGVASARPSSSAGTAQPGTPSATPSASAGRTLELAGVPEVVFDWATQRCADDQLADLPARAIRAADGQLSVYLSSTTSYRLTGPDFDTLVPDCTPVLESDFDPRPELYSYAEWLGAPYSLDGRTVQAIVHQEFHGDQAGSAWQASRDFATDQDGPWRYLGSTAAGASAMMFDATNRRWQGPPPLCQISAAGMHPDVGCDAVLEWVSPVDGSVTLSGRVFDQDPGGGDGVAVRITLDGRQLFAHELANGDSDGMSFELEVDLAVGDTIRFRVSARGDSGWDSTGFDPGIDIDGPPCPSQRHDLCTLISLTLAESNDGGATFSQPDPPDHLVAAFPVPYDAD